MVPALCEGNGSMTRLSDTQAIILSAAAQRPDGNVLPLPGSLRGGAAGKVVAALLARGFVREQAIDSQIKADTALNTIWRNDDDGRGVLLLITPAGLDAIGVEAEADRSAVDDRFDANSAGEPASGPTAGAEAAPAADAAQEPTAAPAPRTARPATPAGKTREGTKQALLVDMLRRADGVTIAEVVAATGWQPHTVRGAFAGALKKRLGLTVVSEKVDGRGRVYRIAD